MGNTVLREILSMGLYKLQDEEELLKARADSRTRKKWLRSNAHDSDEGKAKPS